MTDDLKELLENVYNKPILKVRTPDFIYLQTDLSEEYHIDFTFTKMLIAIQDIYENNYKSTDNALLYTGYNFNEITQKCNKQHNEDIDIPIYIQIIYASDNNEYSAVVDKDESPDKIIIQINSSKIEENISLLYGSLHHEFLHIREMYAKSDINILKSFKNKIPENETNKFIYLNNYFFNIIMCICYVFKESEQRARKNWLYQYLISKPKSELYNVYVSVKKRSDGINKVLELGQELTQLSLMADYITNIEIYMQDNDVFVEALLYYGTKYRIITKGLSQYHFDYKMLYTSNNEQLRNISERGFNELILRYNKFKHECQNIVYRALKDKDILN